MVGSKLSTIRILFIAYIQYEYLFNMNMNISIYQFSICFIVYLLASMFQAHSHSHSDIRRNMNILAILDIYSYCVLLLITYEIIYV